MIYVEDLQVSARSKSAKGTEEEHGKNVKQKSGLNWAIQPILIEFRPLVDHKMQWLGSFIVAVPAAKYEQNLPHCGY